MSLDNWINKFKLVYIDENVNQNESEFNSSFDSDENFSTKSNTNYDKGNWTSQYQEYFENRSREWKIVIIILYSLIVIVSLFGNSIVCKIVFFNSAMRSATNIYLGNLSISDLLMTALNIPLQLTKILSQNWPLGQFLCKCLPFFQAFSVNVSSFTMACIALDRYYALVYPLKPRATMRSMLLKIIVIWLMAMIVASPYPILAGVEEDITYNPVIRCRLIYPDYVLSQYQFRQSLTLIYLFIQYLTPLCITGITYFKICYILWHRGNIGVMSEEQRIRRYVAKWKAIKMLIIILLVFAICWCPLNIYHTYQDFRGLVGHTKHNSLIFLTCHWFAMSSVCYNPFLYCWLNDKFRNDAKLYMRWFLKIVCIQSDIGSGSYHRNQFLRKEVIKRRGKSYTFSSRLNSQSSNKTCLVFQDTEDKHPCGEESCCPDTSKIREEFILSDFEMKDRGVLLLRCFSAGCSREDRILKSLNSEKSEI